MPANHLTLQRFRTLQINNTTIKLQIWDTAGQERYRTVTNSYYKGADGIIIVFDLTSKESFENLPNWLSDVHERLGEDVNIIVFANKSDIEDPTEFQVTDEEIAQFTKDTGIKVIKTSARTGNNVDDSFLEMTKTLITKRSEAANPDDRKKNMGLAFKRLQLGQSQ